MAKKNLEGAVSALFTQGKAQEAQPQVITEEKKEELSQAMQAKQSKQRGRPKKWEDGVRADGYSRTSIMVNDEKYRKVQEIAFRETLTKKELFEVAMDIMIEKYEKAHKITLGSLDIENRDIKSIFK